MPGESLASVTWEAAIFQCFPEFPPERDYVTHCVFSTVNSGEGPSHSGADHSSEDSVGGKELFLGLTQRTIKHCFGWLGPISKLDLLISQVGVVSLDL